MAETLRVRLVTPDRILVDQAAEAVEVPAKTGYLEVLRGHAPLLAELGRGRSAAARRRKRRPDGTLWRGGSWKCCRIG